MRERAQIATMRSASLNGSGRSSMVSITLKMALFAPIPRASVAIAIKLKPVDFSNMRRAYFTSFITQGFHRLNIHRATRGEVDRGQREGEEREHHAGECRRVGRFDSVKHAAQNAR